MKTTKLLGILLIVALLGFTATFSAYSFYNYYEVREMDMQVEVAEKLGFNTDTDMLNFGANYPGNSCKRFMDISFPKQTRVIVTFEGDFADWVDVDENDFILSPEETKKLSFTTLIPEGAEQGVYTGKAKFYFKRT
jgi:hypothetical protein